jgi:tripartite motif-containing protein 71
MRIIGSEGSADGQLLRPEDIEIDSSDTQYVTDTGNSRIQVFDSNGNFVTKWGSHGSGDGEFEHPHGIGVDSSGNVYIADPGLPKTGGKIQKFSIAP